MELRPKILLLSLVILLTTSLANPTVTSVVSQEIAVSNNPVTADFMGEPPMIIPGIRNWDFETADNTGGPAEEWQYTAFSHTRGNISTDDQFHTGSRSASIEIVPSVGSDYITLASNGLGSDVFVRSGMDLSFWIYSESMNSEVATYIYIWFQNSTVHNFYLYYMLSNPSWWSSGNYSSATYSYVYMDRSDTLVQGQWEQFQTNVYDDLTEIFTSIDSYTLVGNINFYCDVNDYAPSGSHFYIDDASLNNGTEHISNGGFETSSNPDWYFNNPNHDPGYVSLSETHTQGDKALNITALSTTNDTYSHARVYKEQWNHYDQEFASNSVNTILEFDWRVEFSGLSNDFQQYAYLEISVMNISTYQQYDITYMFCSGTSAYWGVNDTNDVYYRFPEYNVSSVWHHANIDVYSIVLDQGWGNLSIYDIVFYVRAWDREGAQITLLIDDFNMNVYPTVVPGFELNLSNSHEFTGWYQSPTGNANFNRTETAHSGDYAANMTAMGGNYFRLQRGLYLPVSPTLTTDLYWRLEMMEGDTSGNNVDSFVHIEFDGGQNLYYYLCSSSVPSSSWNDTFYLYYNDDNINNVGSVWNHLTRNIYEDAQDFLVAPEYITTIRLIASTSGNGNVSMLFDDIHFVVDQTSPTVSRTSGPTSPNYLTSPEVLATGDDSWAGIAEMLIHYRVDSTWSSVQMVDQGTDYSGNIPAMPYNTSVDYYVEAIDREGNSEVDDAGGAYYSYVVGDNIDPDIGFVDPIWYGPATGNLLVNVTAEDPGSGIDHLELFIDGYSVANLTSGPLQYLWETREWANSAYTVALFARDVAGNEITSEIVVRTANDLQGPEIAWVTLSPEVPIYNQDVTVTASVFDSSEIESVTLHYRQGTGDWTNVSMTESSLFVYTAVIPGRPWGTEIIYTISAIDTLGQEYQYGEISYTTTDPNPPSISVSGPPISDSLSGIERFIVFGVDPGSGVALVRMLVDGVSVGFSNTEMLTLDWDTSTVENGNHTLRFEVTDNQGNTAYSELEYFVNNPQGLDALSSAFSDIMSSYGFFIGAGSVIGVFVIGKVLLRRRSAGVATKKGAKKAKK